MIKVDLVKLVKYLLKRVAFIILMALIGFAVLFMRRTFRQDTYTASGTMYVYNGNPNLVNYQYTSSSDLSSAVQLIDTYMVVVKSNKVMDVVTERLALDYPGIMPEYISSTLTMSPVNETGVVRVSSTTPDPQFSADIVNAVLDIAPGEIIRVVSAGGIEIIDYAMPPEFANSHHAFRRGVLGGLIGGFFAVALLTLLFIMNRRVSDTEELTDNYTPPVLASVRRSKDEWTDPSTYLLTNKSAVDKIESYAKLRMNLLYTLVDKNNNAVVITSPISGEGKSTIAANLAISCAQSKKVLLIDGDMRRGCQQDIFQYKHKKGLSEVLVGSTTWNEAILKDVRENLDLLPAGKFPPNPALSSKVCKLILLSQGGLSWPPFLMYA
ncbi:MAG: AAA family ATPase [Lachnospiraceae bacterium]|nr:AAA family ATPase [Lachnospiraceae bacterium]